MTPPPPEILFRCNQLPRVKSADYDHSARGKGRPAGKRSDPEFKPFTLLLREQTHRRARRQLEDTRSTFDLSELVEQLLRDWLSQE